MNLAKLALDNSRITISGILIVVFVGVASFLSHPRAEDPTVKIREVHVSAFFPGMSTDRVEELITKPLEAAMREVAEIDEIESTSKTGSAQLKIQIHDRFTDLEPIYQKIRNKADNVRPDLEVDSISSISATSPNSRSIILALPSAAY